MLVQKPTIPKGTRDFGPEEVTKRKYIMNTIEQVFIKYGFMPIETPTMENLSTLQGKYGDEGDQLLFKILNSGDFFKDINEEQVKDRNSKTLTPLIAEKGLRYDLTVPFARYVVMHQNEIAFPFKRYQMQPVWRADRPQKGRYREFWQCDADVVGSDSLLNELDLIQIYDEAFVKLGIKNYELRINNRKILAGIAEVVKSIDHMSTIAVAIDKLDKVGEEGVLKELSQKGFSEDEITKLFAIISIKGENAYILSVLKEKLQGSEEGIKGIEELSFVVEQLQRVNNKVNLKIDFSLARGLSYYTGCIFEAVSLEGSLTSSIGGGGRYDNLTGVFGLEGVSGVGISFGLDRIYDVMEELLLFSPSLNQSTTQLLFCCETEQVLKEALKALKTTRDNGIAAELYTEKVNEKKPLEKPVKYATNKKIQWLCMVKNNENQKAVLVLKNLSEGTQDELAIDEIINKVRR